MDSFYHFFLIGHNIKLLMLYIFIGSASIQIFYYLFFYARVFFFKNKKETSNTFSEPVSIIISAHNEAENLKHYLTYILEQDYPEFEVILINDRSGDETETIIANYKEKYPHLRSSFIKDNGKLKHGKKLAITLGIKASKYDYILLTDADCKPVSNQWIKESVQHFNSKDIVLGYGPYFTKKTFINKIIRFDTLFIALQYMSFSKAGVPYMGIGRNLAYKKDLFIKNRGLASHASLRSGDDDLFINEVANSKNTSISINEKAFVYSNPEENFSDWAWQKGRHFTTFNRYKKLHLFLISTEIYSRILFYILLIALAPSLYSNYLFIGFASTRFVIQITILLYSTYFYKEKGIGLLILLFDFILPILNLFIYLRYPTPKRL